MTTRSDLLLESYRRIDKSLDSNNLPQTTEDEMTPSMDSSTDAVDVEIDKDDSEFSALENKLQTSLKDMGLVSCEAMREEDGDVYVDLAFEDKTVLTLQIYVDDDVAKLAILNDETQDDVTEIDLPDSFVGEDGMLNLDNVDELPVDEIKTALSDLITVSNQVEVFRRSRATGESFKQKKMKKRLTTKLENQNKKLKLKLRNKF